MRIFLFILLFGFSLPLNVFCQQQKTLDSLQNIIRHTKNDTSLAKSYMKIGNIYEHTIPDSALYYFKRALVISEKIHYTGFRSESLNHIGNIYADYGKYLKAIHFLQQALRLSEKNRDKEGIAKNMSDIGRMYENQKDLTTALDFYQKALAYYEDVGDTKGVTGSMSNIAIIYSKQKKYKEALSFMKNSLKIFEKENDKYGIAFNMVNIGNIYFYMDDHKNALTYLKKASVILEEINDKASLAAVQSNLANIYKECGQYQKAINCALTALKISKEIGNLNYEWFSYNALSKTYAAMGNYKKALEYKDLLISVNDSIFNTEKMKALTEMQTRYETEKKEQQIKLQQEKLAKSREQTAKERAEREKQQAQRNSFIAGFVFMLILSLFIFYFYRQKQKSNRLLTEQKQQIEKIHHEVSQSIDYATRLQAAILPELSILEKYFSDYMVFFHPRDKVSGDFYWWTHVENYTVITVADCTGHGVPGAFMSMLGASFLREIVEKEYITHTGVILRKLRKEIIKTLKQKGEEGEQKDGMDMAIISINHKTNIVQFSGANNPLYIIKPVIATTDRHGLRPRDDEENKKTVIASEQSERGNLLKDNSSLREAKLRGNLPNNDEIATPPQAARNDALILVMTNNELGLYEVKPDKMPIAIYERMDKFTTHEIQIEKGDQLYMFSDGYADQFGGKKGKKFKYKPFKRLLLENANKPMKEQKEILEKIFIEWKGNNEQVDDVTVVGLKI